MTISKSVAVFIDTQRKLLDRLERFAETEDYRRLQAAVGPIAAGDGRLARRVADSAVAWPARTAHRRGGKTWRRQLVEQHLLRIASFSE
jgi:hypothetical protein